MNWLNINLTTLRAPAYLGSSPVERATWLQLLAYCADQENGGLIEGGAAWKDRQWQQSCGVTLREVRASSRLIFVEGGDVRVLFYPVEKETEVRVKREAGRDAANRRWHGRLNGEENKDEGGRRKDEVEESAAAATGSAIANGCDSFFGSANAEGERKGRELEKELEVQGKGKESTVTGNATDAAQAVQPAAVSRRGPSEAARRDEVVFQDGACSQKEAVLHGNTLVPPCPEVWSLKWWEDCEKRGWVDRGGVPIRKWRPALSSYWRGVQETERRTLAREGGGGNAPQRERPMSAYEIKTRMDAMEKELGQIYQRAREGRSEDGLRTIKIYTPEQEARRGELKKAKETLHGKLTERV